MNEQQLRDELAKARAELEDACRRVPAHTVRPHQIQEIERLEERVEELERRLSR